MAKWTETLADVAGKLAVFAGNIISPTATKIVREIHQDYKDEQQAKIDRFNAPRFQGPITKESLFGTAGTQLRQPFKESAEKANTAPAADTGVISRQNVQAEAAKAAAAMQKPPRT